MLVLPMLSRCSTDILGELALKRHHFVRVQGKVEGECVTSEEHEAVELVLGSLLTAP